jgi:hypothetical protein
MVADSPTRHGRAGARRGCFQCGRDGGVRLRRGAQARSVEATERGIERERALGELGRGESSGSADFYRKRGGEGVEEREGPTDLNGGGFLH